MVPAVSSRSHTEAENLSDRFGGSVNGGPGGRLGTTSVERLVVGGRRSLRGGGGWRRNQSESGGIKLEGARA